MKCELHDINTPELDIYARLREPELAHFYEPNGGLFIAESPKVIMRALNAGYIPESVLIPDENRDEDTLKLLDMLQDNVTIYTAPDTVLEQITGYKLIRGALAAMRRNPLKNVHELVAECKRIAVLEDVVNPTNLGAIFRSAAALGIDAIVLSPGCTNPLYRRCLRVSMGTVFQIPWTISDMNMEEWKKSGITCLKELGYVTVAMALSDESVNIDDNSLHNSKHIAVVLGNEGNGLSQSTIDNCDYTVKIPMRDGVDSLNVAAASAVAFWELCK